MSGEWFERRPACPVCGDAGAATIFSCAYTDDPVRSHIVSHYRKQGGDLDLSPLAGTDYVLKDCGTCGLIYQENIPTPKMLDVVYNKYVSQDWLKGEEKKRLTLASHRIIERQFEALFEQLGLEPNAIRMLDYGFGYGRWARVAVGMGAEVYATEISPEKVAFAQSVGVKIIPEGEIGPTTFHLINTEQVFEHLTHPRETFGHLAGALAPGGIFKISVPRQGNIRDLLRTRGLIDWSPYERNFDDRVDEIYNTILPLEHLNSYGTKTIAYLAKLGGFDVRNGPNGSRYVVLDRSNASGLYRSGVESLRRFVRDRRQSRGTLLESGFYLMSRPDAA